jgi:hypothetical protein
VALFLSSVTAPVFAGTQALVESAVFDQLAASTDGRTFVIVVLERVAPGPVGQLELQQQRVAEVQQRVLDALAPGQLVIGYRLQNAAVIFVMPAGVPAGTELYLQWAIQDHGAVQNVALSNALKGVTT